MPRLTVIQSNFTAGEITPRLYGRVDIDRYRNAAKTLENVVILPQGGVGRRDGLSFVAPAKHADKKAVLIPYVFNEDQAYVLEVGDAYIRVFKTDATQVMAGAVPYEVQTSYAEADVAALDFCQGADTMFLMHQDYVTSRLRRFADNAWVFDAVPWIVQPFDEIGSSPALTLAIDDASAGTGRTFTASDSAFYAADVGREIHAQGGIATITSVTSATVAVGTITTPFQGTSIAAGLWTITGSPQTTVTPSVATPVGASVTLTLAAAGWRAEDVGKFVDLNGGLVQITSITSSTVAVGTIHAELASDVASEPLAWILEGSVWGGLNGHPRTGTFFQQRLWLAGSPGFPQSVWGSRIGEYYNYELGVLDTDALVIGVVSDELNPIVNLSQIDVLIPMTYGGEFTIRGGNDAPVTPTNGTVNVQSNFGCNLVRPVRVGNELIFVERGGRKIRAMSADNINVDKYGAPDITVLSAHMTIGGITGMAYRAQPDPLLYCVRGDGVVPTCTIDRDQDLVGWTRIVTDGVVESICRVPVSSGDQVWALVKRTINGQDVRYVERFTQDVMTDSAKVQADAAGKDTWDGLDHLEGRTVVVKADGVAMANRVVRQGAITIERPAKKLEAGIGFVPRVEALRREILQGGASTLAMPVDAF